MAREFRMLRQIALFAVCRFEQGSRVRQFISKNHPARSRVKWKTERQRGPEVMDGKAVQSVE